MNRVEKLSREILSSCKLYFTVHTCFTYTRMYFYARVSTICTYLSGLLLSTLDSTSFVVDCVCISDLFTGCLLFTLYSIPVGCLHIRPFHKLSTLYTVQYTCWAVYISDLFTSCLLFTLYSRPVVWCCLYVFLLCKVYCRPCWCAYSNIVLSCCVYSNIVLSCWYL